VSDGKTNDFERAPAMVRNAFLGRRAVECKLDPGFELYKFTHFPLCDPDGRVTPWWFSVTPLFPTDPGLAGVIKQSNNLGNGPRVYSRARAAVTNQWNHMTNLLKARLLEPIPAFAGRCAGQLVDNEDPGMKNVFFIGGAYQLWIPNLTASQIVEI
jgi:hypothetical protein